MWYLVPVTYFDRSLGLSQLGSGHADTGQLLAGTATTWSLFGSPRRAIPWIFVTVVDKVQVLTHD